VLIQIQLNLGDVSLVSWKWLQSGFIVLSLKNRENGRKRGVGPDEIGLKPKISL
jgi:hypothetical protein